MNETSQNATYYMRYKDIIKKKLESILQRIKKR